MRAEQRKTRARVFGDHRARLPTRLAVTALAVEAELSAMNIFMTSSATMFRKLGDRTAIVVAQKTRRREMRAGERHSRGH